MSRYREGDTPPSGLRPATSPCRGGWSENGQKLTFLIPPQACLGEVAARSADGGEMAQAQRYCPSTAFGGPPPQASLGRIFGPSAPHPILSFPRRRESIP
ncbi:hypothetical protein A6768_14820 [Sphingobium yanoikuyae]|uniref:Uncharacterized protein n=1 Tax=Sphingobium yanoikuyae TaxID=13690 RepID=A0A291N1V5_SPHYA|nr:hypothetical protein A6768_14820 [Sphingobium yanoikuyae]